MRAAAECLPRRGSLEAVAGLMNEGVARLCDILARIAGEGRDVNIWRQLGARPNLPCCVHTRAQGGQGCTVSLGPSLSPVGELACMMGMYRALQTALPVQS